MFRFLRVNMAAKTCVFEDIPEEYAGLGGRALTSTVVAREVNPICTPLGPHNKLVFAPRPAGRHQQPQRQPYFRGLQEPPHRRHQGTNSGGQPAAIWLSWASWPSSLKTWPPKANGGSWN